jgi:hypothetical protein
MISREDIVTVLGPIDDDLVSEVAALDPSPEELMQAWTWVSADEALVNEGRSLPSGKIAQLIEILSPPDGDERR